MKKKMIMLAGSLMVLLLMFAACGSSDSGEKVTTSSSSKKVSVKDDLISYVNDNLQDLDARQTEIFNMYDSVSGANYTSDEAMFAKIESEIIPTYQPLITDMEAVRPSTPEVRELHEILISANNTQFNAMSLILAALETGDYAKIEEANTKLDTARKLMRDFANELETLAADNKVELTFD